MEFQPKPISKQGVAAAMEKAKRYRLLNEPVEAESICLDILAIEPDHQEALITQLLAITDQLGHELSGGVRRAREVLTRVPDAYGKHYYEGIICERYAHAQLRHGAPRAGELAYAWLRDAMHCYEQAEALRPAENDDAILRWNSCARLLARNPSLQPAREEAYEPSFE